MQTSQMAEMKEEMNKRTEVDASQDADISDLVKKLSEINKKMMSSD